MKKLYSICLLGLLFYSAPMRAKFQAPDDIQQMLASMSIEQKIGQLFMVAVLSEPEFNPGYERSVYTLDADYVEHLIRNYHVGGVVFLGTGSKEAVRTMVDRFQASAEIPLLMALDAEWGSAMRLVDGFCCEKNKQLARRTNQEIHDIAVQIGNELKELGLHINFAPVVDVNTNPKNPVIGVRSFGSIPELVASKATAYMQGLHDAGIISCAKHFPGHGDTAVDSHVDLPQLKHDKKRLHSVELYPFVQMIKVEVPMIMVGHLSVPAFDATGTAASVSRPIVHGLLREQLGFKSIIITDGLGMGALRDFGKPGELECAAVCAGNDIVLCPVHVPEAVACINQALTDGRLGMQELDEHVLRVLMAKRRAQLC
jgi:beta-glucosidase-like glycosyl hydrolase